jgi:hypothetical protein
MNSNGAKSFLFSGYYDKFNAKAQFIRNVKAKQGNAMCLKFVGPKRGHDPKTTPKN